MHLARRVSTLEDVVLTASRRLIHPTLHSSSERLNQTATAVVCRAITCCSELSAALALPGGKVQLAAVSSCTSTDWSAAKTELAESSSVAMREYWEAVYSKRHLGLKVARSSEVGHNLSLWGGRQCTHPAGGNCAPWRMTVELIPDNFVCSR